MGRLLRFFPGSPARGHCPRRGHCPHRGRPATAWPACCRSGQRRTRAQAGWRAAPAHRLSLARPPGSQSRPLEPRREDAAGDSGLDQAGKQRVLDGLTAAEGLERYLHTKYVGQKRFSLEGGDSLIPMIDDVVRAAGDNGIKELVIGMAHRGRLNVLVNILGKPPKTLFDEFE